MITKKPLASKKPVKPVKTGKPGKAEKTKKTGKTAGAKVSKISSGALLTKPAENSAKNVFFWELPD